MSDLRNQKLGQIRRAATMVELRLRLARGLRVLPHALTIALAVVAGALVVRKIVPDALSNRRAWEIIGGAAALAVIAVAVAVLRRLPPAVGAVMLDKHHRLAGRLTNALAFEGQKDRSPLMEVAIDDACEHAEQLSPGRAAPLSMPRDLIGSAVVAAGVAAIAMLHVLPKQAPPPPQAKVIDAVQLSPDDVELFRDAAKELNKREQSPEVKAAVEKFNQLIEDIANKRLDRAEAFRRMEEIERELMKGAEADAKSFEEALKQTSDELKKSDLTKPVGESIEKKDFEKAKKDLKQLASDLRDQKSGKAKKADKAALEKLRQALQKAAQKKKEALAAINEKRNELREQLLNKKSQKKNDPDAGAQEKEEDRLLKKKERELERLDREAERQERAQRKLDRLDRELSKAAEDLMRDLGLSAEDLEQAAEDINRMQEEQMSDKEKEELRQRLEELRELMRQEGKGGKQRVMRMLKFGKRARGNQGGKGQEKGNQGQPGQQGDDGDSEGDDGQDGKDGQGKGGEGKGGEGQGQSAKVLKLVKVPGQGAGQGEGPGMPGGGGQGQGQGQDSPGGAPGKGIGTSHDPNIMGKRTDMKSGTQDVQAQGMDTQQGPSNSEVIYGAAERGFKGKGYKNVYTKYQTRAEEQINKDQIPDGYRFYVHRYFQLIRPRE